MSDPAGSGRAMGRGRGRSSARPTPPPERDSASSWGRRPGGSGDPGAGSSGGYSRPASAAVSITLENEKTYPTTARTCLYDLCLVIFYYCIHEKSQILVY